MSSQIESDAHFRYRAEGDSPTVSKSYRIENDLLSTVFYVNTILSRIRSRIIMLIGILYDVVNNKQLIKNAKDNGLA